eukprot:Gb_06654 [translate_table: standard]
MIEKNMNDPCFDADSFEGRCVSKEQRQLAKLYNYQPCTKLKEELESNKQARVVVSPRYAGARNPNKYLVGGILIWLYWQLQIKDYTRSAMDIGVELVVGVSKEDNWIMSYSGDRFCTVLDPGRGCILLGQIKDKD